MDERVNPWQSQADEWRRFAEQALATWTTRAEPVVKDVAEGMLLGQETVLRCAELMGEAWRSTAASMEAGNDWPAAVERFASQLRPGAGLSPDAVAAATADSAEMWRLYLETVGRMVGPWGESLRQTPGRVGPVLTGDHSAFIQLTKLYWDAWEKTGGRLLESPGLGFTREFNEKLMRGFDAWIEHRRAVAEYHLIVNDAWVDAVTAVLHDLRRRAEQGKPVESLRDFTTLWTTVTDGKMEEAFRSEMYAEAQGRMLNAAMRYRQQERAIVDTFLKMTDVAARSELDEAFREIYLLRRELKALRREVEGFKHASAARPGAAGDADLQVDSVGPKPTARARPKPEASSRPKPEAGARPKRAGGAR